MYAESLNQLIEELKKMPGIGPKSAQRLAFHILATPEKEVEALLESIIQAKGKIKYCSVCFNMTDIEPCRICSDQSREKILCIVADPKDLIAIERSREFKGQYHVLGGVISPLDGVGPESLRIKELLARLQQEKFSEIILALSPTVEGEATIIYLTKLLKPLEINVSRVAYGLPIGADMDYADEATMSKAIEGRRTI